MSKPNPKKPSQPLTPPEKVSFDDTATYAPSEAMPSHNSLVPSKRTTAMSSFDPLPGASLGQCPTNLNLASKEGRAMAFSAMSPGDLDIGDNGHIEFVAVAYLIFPDARTDEETGEVNEFSRTCFFGHDGQTYRTSSELMPHRVKALTELYTPDEWVQGIKLRISERRSRKTGRTYHDIRVIA